MVYLSIQICTSLSLHQRRWGFFCQLTQRLRIGQRSKNERHVIYSTSLPSRLRDHQNDGDKKIPRFSEHNRAVVHVSS